MTMKVLLHCTDGRMVAGVAMVVLGGRCWERGVGREMLEGRCWEGDAGREGNGREMS